MLDPEIIVVKYLTMNKEGIGCFANRSRRIRNVSKRSREPWSMHSEKQK